MNNYSDDHLKKICEIPLVDAEKLSRARSVPSAGALQAQAETFKLLGDPGRLRILHALCAEELCVCDLSAVLDSSPSAVSHQLRLLRAGRLVRFRKEGKMVYYRLGDHRVHSWLAMMAPAENEEQV